MAAQAPAAPSTSIAVAPATGRNQIKEGEFVILDVNGERQSFLKVKEKATVRVGKGSCSTAPLIGAHFGSLFELSASETHLEKRKRVCETAGEDWEGVLEIDRNNSNLQDAGTANQALTAEDIARLRSEGKSGDEIIAALTENSATFQNKTQYSQEKYKRKKAKKYLTRVTPIRPTATSIAAAFFAKTPAKLGGLRGDSLAILLSLANVGAHCRTLVVDCISGMVTGAALERMGGQGALVNAFLGARAPASDIINMFNFPDDVRRSVLNVSLEALRQHLKDDDDPMQTDAAAVHVERPAGAANDSAGQASQRAEPAGNCSAAAAVPDGAAKDPPSQEQAQVYEQRREEDAFPAENCVSHSEAAINGPVHELSEEEKAYAASRKERNDKIRRLCRQGFQSCIIAAPDVQPSILIRTVLPLLAPSASFAIFFSTLQPLADCMQELQVGKEAVALQLQESWWRQYQVLPGRTHPQMSTSGTGGYILSGIKVV